jgi:hypothetical protein
MRRFLLAFLLLVSSTCFSQDSLHQTISAPDTSEMGRLLEHSQYLVDSLRTAREYAGIQQTMEYVERQQAEDNAKKKKQAVLYIVLGIVGLVVLIMGMRRKTRK